MQPTSDIWQRLWSDPNHVIERKIVMDGADEYNRDEICSPIVLRRDAMEDKAFGIGAVCAATMKFSLRPKNKKEIPVGAKAELFVRLTLGGESSEWLRLGTFYVENRKTTLERVDFECVDATYHLDSVWLSGVSNEYTPCLPQAINEIALLASIEIDDESVGIPMKYFTKNVNDLTKRQAISFIASAVGCNAAINEHGKLQFYPLAPPDNLMQTYNAFASASLINDPITVRKLTVQYGEGENAIYTRGSGNATQELFLYNEWVTPEIADELYNHVLNYGYRPVEARSAHIDPAVQLGDAVNLDGCTTQLWSFTLRLDGHALYDIHVPGNGILGSEMGRYVGQYDSDTDRRINRLRTELISVIVACEHISSAGAAVTIRPEDSFITEIKSGSTYHFTVAYPIPVSPILRIVDHDDNLLASRRWGYTNGKEIATADFVIGARLEVRDSGERFFSDAVSGEPVTAQFSEVIAARKIYKAAVPGYSAAVRGDI